MATKYLIIATSFSGRIRLHLCISLSVHDLEMKDWQRGLSALLREGGGDQVASAKSHVSARSAALLRVLFLFVSLLLCHLVETPPGHLIMHVILEFIAQSLH